MAFLSDNVLDGAVGYVDTNASHLYICSEEPANYTEATSTYKLGAYIGVDVDVPEDGDVNGRKVRINAITSGSVSSSGSAGYWALTDGSSELIAAKSLSNPQNVTAGNVFTLTAFDIEIPDA
ncbi:MAG: hypothetical protein ACW987_15690 [Candidatus Thorarchaeota archaeon]|jgi:hypothetical protein